MQYHEQTTPEDAPQEQNQHEGQDELAGNDLQDRTLDDDADYTPFALSTC